jgi:hypothetical protein
MHRHFKLYKVNRQHRERDLVQYSTYFTTGTDAVHAFMATEGIGSTAKMATSSSLSALALRYRLSGEEGADDHTRKENDRPAQRVWRVEQLAEGLPRHGADTRDMQRGT